MSLSATGNARRLFALGLATSLVFSAPLVATADNTAKLSDMSGAKLLAAAGFDEPLADLKSTIRLQLFDSQPRLAAEVVDYAAEPFDAAALTAAIGADVDASLSAEMRSRVSAFFASPLGAKLSAMTRRHQQHLKKLNGQAAAEILKTGTDLVQDDERGLLYSELHDRTGWKSFDDLLIYASSHALIAGDGKLDSVLGDHEAIEAELRTALPPNVIADLAEFNLPSFAYAYRDASAEELRSLKAFLQSEAGAAFADALRVSIIKRINAANDQLLARLIEKRS